MGDEKLRSRSAGGHGLADGIAHAEQVGFEVLLDRGRESVADLTHAVVHVGMSLGVLHP